MRPAIALWFLVFVITWFTLDWTKLPAKDKNATYFFSRPQVYFDILIGVLVVITYFTRPAVTLLAQYMMHTRLIVSLYG